MKWASSAPKPGSPFASNNFSFEGYVAHSATSKTDPAEPFGSRAAGRRPRQRRITLPDAPPSNFSLKTGRGANLRTFPLRFSGIRGAPLDNWDLSLIKNTKLKENVQLQFRAEAINAFNHAQFLPPETNPVNTAFGRVTDERAWPRVIQFGLKILF